ncbi:Uncharacterised protein [uncultured archaeon]|nr:Uncharacterised protein [uncultured archaeon]
MASDSISFNIDKAVLGDASFELRCAYGYNNNLLHPTFFIDSVISDIAFFATIELSPSSIATNATTTSSIFLEIGSISSADFISFFTGVNSILSQ